LARDFVDGVDTSGKGPKGGREPNGGKGGGCNRDDVLFAKHGRRGWWGGSGTVL